MFSVLFLFICVYCIMLILSAPYLGASFSPPCPLFVCVCHCCCVSVQSLLVTDGFHDRRHRHHHQYDSYTSIFLLFEGAIFLSVEGKNENTFTLSCQLRWPQKCEQKHFKSDLGEPFLFFSPITFWIRVRGGN